MTKRATKSARLASSENRTHLASVTPGNRCRLLDGSIVLVAANLNGGVFVRDNDGTGRGPYEMPGETVVVEVIAPAARYDSKSAVNDPLAGFSLKGAKR